MNLAISQHQTVIRDFNSQNRNPAWVSKWDEYQNYWVLINVLWIRLDLSDIDMWDIDLSDTDLDFLDTDIPSKHSVCLQDVSKTSSRDVFKTSSRHVFKMSWKTKNCYAEDVLKTSSRHVLKTSWRPTNVCWVWTS